MNPSFKLPPKLRAQLDRFEAMPLRQRLIVGVCVCALLALVLDSVLVSPVEQRGRTLGFIMASQQEELQRVQAELAAMDSGQYAGDPQLIARLAELEQQARDIDRSLAASQRQMVAGSEVPRLLRDLLGDAPGVTLLSLQSLPAVSVLKPAEASGDESAAQPEAKPQSAPAAASGPNLYRHGIHMVLRGDYLKVMAALARIEALPWKLYWARLDMLVPPRGETARVEGVPPAWPDRAMPPPAGAKKVLGRPGDFLESPEFHVVFYTLSLEQSWLRF